MGRQCLHTASLPTAGSSSHLHLSSWVARIWSSSKLATDVETSSGFIANSDPQISGAFDLSVHRRQTIRTTLPLPSSLTTSCKQTPTSYTCTTESDWLTSIGAVSWSSSTTLVWLEEPFFLRLFLADLDSLT